MKSRVFFYFHIPALMLLLLLLLMGCSTQKKNEWVEGCYYGSYLTYSGIAKQEIDEASASLIWQSCEQLEVQAKKMGY